MRNHMPHLSFLAVLAITCGSPTPYLYAQQQSSFSSTKKNILFIAVDDLRPELGCYGASYMQTPHIDRLATQGLVFENAYCQQAVCAPSRNSVMTGLRPDAINIYDLATFFRKTVPDVITLPQQFKHNGYAVEGVGKIYHDGHGNQNDTLSWSVPFWTLGDRQQKLQKVTRGDTTGLESSFPAINGEHLPYYKSDMPENQFADGMIADIAVSRLHALKENGGPFFLAVGFKLPHLPFVAPAKYWEMYNSQEIEVPSKTEPADASKYAFVRWSGELGKYHGIEQYKEKGVLPDKLSRNLIHGYYASTSMIDAQIGKLLDALDKLGISDNTIVVLWGDHGWKLGEYGMWCKHSNAELDVRTTLIISAPKYVKGESTQSLAELVDIYPTLCDLSGIEKPDHLQGASLVPILKNPETTVKSIAMSQYPRGKALPNDSTKKAFMGYSITDGRYRFTRWQSYENPKLVVDKELYDLTNGRLAMKNLAQSTNYKKEMERMEHLLEETLRNQAR